MKTVRLLWAPSPSPGVEAQVAKIVNAESLEVYGQATLEPAAAQYSTPVPEGVTVQGTVTTIRGEEQVTDVSDTLDVGFGPLQGVTDLSIGVVTPGQLPS